ncbi:MAG: pilus assembly protein [Acidobacteria bacterium]|nr:pilus assembly protein [Acidobacteriota bacterium]
MKRTSFLSKVGNLHRPAMQSGTALVELAMVTPFMALLLAGLLHFGMTMRAQQVITNASRVAARRGTQSGASSGAMQTAARTYVEDAGLELNKLTLANTPGDADNDSTCTASYQFTSPVQAFIDSLMSSPIQGGAGGGTWWTASEAPPRTLTATTVMRY